MQARCGLNENDDVLVDRYFHGLRIDIQYILTFKNFDNVDEIIQHAIKAEDIANYQARKFSVSKWPGQKTPAKPDFNPSANSSEKFSSKSEDQNKFTCFHCKQKGHRAFECPKRITLIEGTQEEPETADDPKSEESNEVEEIAAKTDGALLLVQKESIPTVEKKWLRKNIFRSTGTIHRENCTVVIDGGSCENIISQTLVDRLKLKAYKHNRPYFVKMAYYRR